MATYLIDYENTGVKGLVGIEQLPMEPASYSRWEAV
jgi:hypothetical protein